MRARTAYPFHFQSAVNDCAIACVQAVAEHYGMHLSIDELRRRLGSDPKRGIAVGQFAAGLGNYFAVQTGKQPHGRVDPTCLPFIGYLPDQRHFVVVWSIDRRGRLLIGDPSQGLVKMSIERFSEQWSGITVVLRPAGELAIDSVAVSNTQSGWQFIRSLFSDDPGLFVALAVPATVLGLVNTIFSVIFPYYLTRFPQVIWLAAGYSLLILLISNTVTWISAWLKRRFGLLIGERLSGFAERLDQRFYTSGDLYTRYQDIDSIVEIVTQLSRDLPYAAMIFLGAVSYMIYVNWLLTVVVLTVVALLLLAITPFLSRAREYVYEIRLRLARMNNDVHRFVEEGGKVPGRSWAGVLAARYRQTLWRLPVSALLGQTATLGLLAVIAFAHAQSAASFGYARLMSLIAIMNYLTSAGTGLYGHYVDWQLAQPSVRRLQDFMELKVEEAVAV